MNPEMRINHMIKKVSAFIDNDAGRDTCRQLGKQAFDCLAQVVGSNHPYANIVAEASFKEKSGLSTACGVLWAVKLHLDNERHGTRKLNDTARGWRELSGRLS